MGSQTDNLFRFCSCRRLFCFAAIAVLLLLKETTSDEERRRDEYFANVGGRYVLVREYAEQLTMATKNMFSLLWFCEQWNASVVMPFVKDSQFYGLWKRWNNKTTLPLDLFYERSQFDSLLADYQLPPLVSIDTFLSKAKRNLTVLQLIYNGDTLGGNSAEVTKRFNKGYVIECSDTVWNKQQLAGFVKHLNERATSPFSVKACYSVNASHAINPNKLAEIIGIQGESDASVVFDTWRGISGSDVYKFRMFVPEFAKAGNPRPGSVALQYSLYVRRNASSFLRSLNIETEFVVIHFRSERIGRRDERINGYFAQCWEETLRILQEDILSEHPNITVLYFTDYGPLGSIGCRRQNCRGARIVNATLAKNGLKATHFDPNKFNAVSDSGFVALVEQNVMAMSRYLVLVGGGSFQMQIQQQFKRQPTAKGGYTVCDGDKISSHTFK